MKYESLKLMHSKEYNLRKEKEAKLEQVHAEMTQLQESLDDVYTQIDQMQEAIKTLEDERGGS